MEKVKQKVFLISEKQREALLNYLLDRPYREVAIAIQILAKAPTTEIEVEIPKTESPIPEAQTESNPSSVESQSEQV